MRGSKELPLARHDREACDLDVRHTVRRQRPAAAAGDEAENAEVGRGIEVARVVVEGDARDRLVVRAAVEVVAQVLPGRAAGARIRGRVERDLEDMTRTGGRL